MNRNKSEEKNYVKKVVWLHSLYTEQQQRQHILKQHLATSI